MVNTKELENCKKNQNEWIVSIILVLISQKAEHYD
jgi:hypothetical protein